MTAGRVVEKPAPSGVYSLTHGRPPSPVAAQRRYVAGLSVRTYWQHLEPEEGHHDWLLFDKTLALAKAHDKQVAFRVMNGTGTPQWVTQAGARWYEARDRAVARAPVPWDEVFLEKWSTFIGAFGERYDRDPTVTLVAMCMPAGQWAEIFHPLTLPEVPDYSYRQFIAAHYRVIDAYVQAFPNTALSLALTGHEKDGTLQRIAGDLTDYLVARFGPHNPKVYIQANGWSEAVHQSANVMLARTFDHCWAKPLQRGLQQVAGVQWQYRTPPDTRMGDQFLANAVLLKFGASFAEVYEVDVLAEAEQPALEQLGDLYARHARISAEGLFIADGIDCVRYTLDKTNPVSSPAAISVALPAEAPSGDEGWGLTRSAYVRYAACTAGKPVLQGGYPFFVATTFNRQTGAIVNRGAERMRYTTDGSSPVAPMVTRPPSPSSITVAGDTLVPKVVGGASAAGNAPVTVRLTPIVTREDGKELTGDVFEVGYMPGSDSAEHATAAGDAGALVVLTALAEPERRVGQDNRPRTGEEL